MQKSKVLLLLGNSFSAIILAVAPKENLSAYNTEVLDLEARLEEVRL